MKLTRRSLLSGMAASAALGAIPAQARAQWAKQPIINPVLFWNAASLELVALDHSLAVDDARAPGPCASARALGAVHAVIADAVHFAYRTDYWPQFYRGRLHFDIYSPELFVGGAASAVLARIYDTPTHAYTIGERSEGFKKLFLGYPGRDWEAGVAFARSGYFRELWNWDNIRRTLLPQFSQYVPRPRSHNGDPFNAAQGFYGDRWGDYRPLVLDNAHHVAALAPGAPPPEGSPEYEGDLAEVRVKGALRSQGDRFFAPRTPHETNIGLFWAYDGARLIGAAPRLFNQIVRQIAIQDRFDVAEMARLFALCNLAMADACIVAWYAKYRYNVWRPVLGIQDHREAPQREWLPLGAPKTNPLRFSTSSRETAQSLMGAGLAMRLGEPSPEGQLRDDGLGGDLRPLYREAAFTPNFPSYPSGHATMGAACFTVLKLARRERQLTYNNPDAVGGEFVSDELNGTSIDHFTGKARPYYPIAYRRLSDMIKDNELSRVYLGVHWRFDCNQGSASGLRIANAIYDAAYGHYARYSRSRS